MYIKVNRIQFKKELMNAKKLRLKDNPLLSCAKLTVTGNGKLEVGATDSNHTFIGRVDSTDGNTLTGSAIVEIDHLKKLMTKVNDKQIELTYNEETEDLEIITDVAEFTVKSQPKDEWPEILPEFDEANHFITVTADFIEKITDKRHFISTDDLRPAMMGMLFEVSDSGLNAVAATDGHKLYANEVSEPEGEEAQYIISDTILELLSLNRVQKRLPETVTLQFGKYDGDPFVSIQAGNYTIYSKLINEQYPNWRSVVPDEETHNALIPADEVLEAVQTVKLAGNSVDKHVTFQFDESDVTISAEDIDLERSAKSKPIPYESGSANIRIGFNAKYAEQAIKSLNAETVNIKMSSPNRAAILQNGNPDELVLLMPVMLDSYGV